MADNLSDIVEIFISKESTAIDTASFSIPLILAAFTNFSSRTRTYDSITSVGSDFATTSQVYRMAQKLFSGESVRPSTIVVGRRQIDNTVLTPVAADNTAYTVTINDVAYTITSGTTATATTIVTALKAAIGTPAGVTVGGTSTLTLAATTPGSPWSVSYSSNITAADGAPAETWTAALNAVETENSSWYALVSPTHVTAEQVELATAVQSMYKIYGTSTQDPVALTTGTSDILSLLSAASFGRTFAVYTATADVDFPEAAWISTQLPETPGSNDWDMKQADGGVTVSNISPTAKVNVVDKNGNIYTTRAGVAVFQYGNMSDGTPIDEVIFLDWLRARWQEAVVFRFINSKKVPYTRVGATIIENDIRGVMALGVTNGGIADAPQFTVTAPDPLKVSPTLRAQRVLGDFLATFRLAGSLRKVIIRATASV